MPEDNALDIGDLIKGAYVAPGDQGGEQAAVNMPSGPCYPLLTLDDLDALPDPIYWVDGILKGGDIVILYGSPKSGKTFAVIDLAAALAAGSAQWAGRFDIDQPRRVLYATMEGRRSLKHRFCGAMQRHPGGRANIRISEKLPNIYDIDDDYRPIRAFIEDIRDFSPEVVILDTLALSMTGGDENTAKDAAIVQENIERIREGLGGEVAIVLIHHATKAGDSLRGSSGWLGMADTAIEFSLNESGGGRMKGTAFKDAESFAPIAYGIENLGDPRVAAIRWDGKAESKSTKGSKYADVIEYMTAYTYSIELAKTRSEIAQAMDVKQDYVKNAINALKCANDNMSALTVTLKPGPQGKPVQHWYLDLGGNQ
jgi:RecA-family ATPase